MLKTSPLNAFSFGFLLCCCSLFTHAQDRELLDIAEAELTREYAILSKAEIPAYYIDYRIDDIHRFYAAADLGSLVQRDSSRFRYGSASVRVGSYEFDNTFEPGENNPYGRQVPSVAFSYLPLDNRPLPVRQFLWELTTEAYTSASEDFEELQSSEVDTTAGTPPNFSRETPSEFHEPPLDFHQVVDTEEWTERVKRISSLFLEYDDVVYGTVSTSVYVKRGYFVSTEGSRIAENFPYAYVFINAGLRGSDKRVVHLSKSYFAFQPDDLPSEETMRSDATQMVADLRSLAEAPTASPYTGPAILAPRAAGVFFHEIFGHRIEGHRLRSELDGQTYKERINERVLPEGISVISDPTLSRFGGQDLNGSYAYDDEGIRARRVAIVEDGILKSFLMSRTPLDSIVRSNGHGRAQAGHAPVSRQSNLLIESSDPVSEEEMRQMLIEECKHQGKEYGYFFKDVEGGFTETSRYSTNAFNIKPTLVYRVYVDGRPDELVRGVDLIGTPLAMFAEIAGTSDRKGTFIGFCGAESGSVPVSATSPGLLVRRIETQKKPAEDTFEEKILLPPTTALDD